MYTHKDLQACSDKLLILKFKQFLKFEFSLSAFKYLLILFTCFSLLPVSTNAQIQKQVMSPQVGIPTSPPGAPGPVTGPGSVLQGSTASYSVTAATGATSYSWSLSTPSAGTITATTTSASIHWSASFSGTVDVICYAVNGLGSTPATVLYVQVTQPVTPLISGVISPSLQNNTTPTTIASTAPSGGNGIYSYQWQSSLNNSTWTNIPGGLGSSYPPQNQTQSTYYKLITTSGTVSVTSNTAFVNTMVSTSYSPSNGIVSVNELTGTANVVIPLYTIAGAQVTFPLNLVYNATGVKASAVEQNAGMGWQVSLGGAVTRYLRGLPDDMSALSDGENHTVYGWLNNNSGQIINSSSFSFINDNNTATCSDETADLSMLSIDFPANFYSFNQQVNISDTEPDIFQVNAPGLSCQLVFDNNKQLRVIPYQDLKVSYITAPQGSTNTLGHSNVGQITSFTITNDQGITYTFSATSITSQRTVQNVNNSVPPIPGEDFFYCFLTYFNNFQNGIEFNSSWGLTSISDTHNNSVNITYTTGPYNNSPNTVQLSAGGAAPISIYTTVGGTSPQLVSSITCTNNLLAQSQTFNISYVNTPNSQGACISSITGEGHRFVFGYNKVVSGGNYTRLFLNSIVDSAQTEGGQALATNSYNPLSLTFNYQSTTSTTSTLASPTQNNVDYWGYTNGNTSNASLLPTIDINPSTAGYERYRNRQASPSPSTVYAYSIAGANREADGNCMAGALSQINYPAGGYTTLTYEPTQYYDNTLQTNVLGGGIRILQVLDHDGISTDKDFIKAYTYRNLSTGISTGKALSLPTFAFTTEYSGTNVNQALWTSATLVSPVDLSGEDHSIFYTAVTETINNGGSTVYQYAIPATNWDTTVPANPTWSPTGLPAWNQTTTLVGRPTNSSGSCTAIGVIRNDVNTYPFPPNTNFDFERGMLTNILKYDNTGTQVAETDYIYQTPEASVDITALRFDHNGLDVTNYAKYTIHTSAGPLLSQVVNKVFDLTNVAPGAQSTVAPLVTTANNVYNTAQHKLSQQNVINSDLSTNTVNIKYVKDYNITTAGDGYTTNLLALQNANMNIPVETYAQFTPPNGTQVTTGADLTLFGTFPNQGVDYMTGGGTVMGAPQPFTVVSVPGPAPMQHRKFTSASGVTNFSSSTISSTNTFQYDSRYYVTENDLGYDYSGFLLSKDDGFQHISTNIYDNFNTFRLKASIKNARFDEVGMDYPFVTYFAFKPLNYVTSPNAYNFAVASGSPVSNITNSSVTRNGEHGVLLPATEILTKTVSKNSAAQNYILSMWVNSTAAGAFVVTATDGTNTVTIPQSQCSYDLTTGNSKYPSGFEYCRITIPLTTLTASNTLTINFSSSQNITCNNILTYPDVANVVMYSYDSYNNKIAETNGNGVTVFYSYDALGRLLYVLDQDNNIIERKTYINN